MILSIGMEDLSAEALSRLIQYGLADMYIRGEAAPSAISVSQSSFQNLLDSVGSGGLYRIVRPADRATELHYTFRNWYVPVRPRRIESVDWVPELLESV